MKLKYLLISVVVALMATLFCITGSAAISGDIDGVNSADVNDARTALRIAIKLDTESTDAQKDIADVDYNGKVEVTDARTILRRAINLEAQKHYFTPETIIAATCTSGGQYKRTCTECDETSFIAIVGELGHNYVFTKEITAVSCTQNGTSLYTCSRCPATKEETVKGGHIWVTGDESGVKQCSRCGKTNCEVYGHSTSLGYCTICGQFADENNLYDTATAIRSSLNTARTTEKSAITKLESAAEVTFSSSTVTLSKEASDLFKQSYNSFYAAYTKCGNTKEFAEAKTVILNIMNDIAAIFDKLPLDGTDQAANLKKLQAIDELYADIDAQMVKLQSCTASWKK